MEDVQNAHSSLLASITRSQMTFLLFWKYNLHSWRSKTLLMWPASLLFTHWHQDSHSTICTTNLCWLRSESLTQKPWDLQHPQPNIWICFPLVLKPSRLFRVQGHRSYKAKFPTAIFNLRKRTLDHLQDSMIRTARLLRVKPRNRRSMDLTNRRI
jgi:hypothetical protein